MSSDDHRLIARVLGEPGLVAAVRSLEPSALGALIERVGVEDAGELVALTTPDQLLFVLDEDLWRSDEPGVDAHLEPARFSVWLDVLAEAGDDVLAERLAELPEETLAAAFATRLLVADPAELELELRRAGPAHADLVDKILDASNTLEVGEYLVAARDPDGWDAITTALLALDRWQSDLLERLLFRCSRASEEQADEAGGWYEVLSHAEALKSDAAAEREDRRARQGFVAPSAARSFLAQAEQTEPDALLSEVGRDPITRMYFRKLEVTPRQAPALASGYEPDAVEAATRPLRQLAGEVARGGADLPSAPGEPSGLRGAMQALYERDPGAHAERMAELGFLANVVLAGTELQGRRHRLVEAVQRAVDVCDEGLQWVVGGPVTPEAGARILRTTGAEKLFRIGWRLRG